MFKEFKEFAARGNVVDLAVGVIIGAAFGKIVTSLVNDVVMPPIGLLIGRVDFRNLYFVAERAGLSVAGRGPEGGRADDQLRPLPQHHPRVPDRRVRGLPDRPADQPDVAAAGCGPGRAARRPARSARRRSRWPRSNARSARQRSRYDDCGREADEVDIDRHRCWLSHRRPFRPPLRRRPGTPTAKRCDSPRSTTWRAFTTSSLIGSSAAFTRRS